MNILEARVALRERTFLDVVDLAVRFVVAHAAPYAKTAALALIPAFALTWWIAAHAGWGWGWTSAFALSIVVQPPFTVVASRLVFAPAVDGRDVAAATLRALPRIVALRVLELVVASFGFLFFVLPGVWVSVLFLFVNEVAVLERAGVVTAASRMQRLVTSQFGDALMAFLFLLALRIVVVFVGDAAGRAVLEDLLQITAPPSILEVKGSALGLLAFWLFVPFEATCRFLLYLNVRTRIEGWDIQTRFAALVARSDEDDGTRGVAA